jgi:hypothetical protein
MEAIINYAKFLGKLNAGTKVAVVTLIYRTLSTYYDAIFVFLWNTIFRKIFADISVAVLEGVELTGESYINAILWHYELLPTGASIMSVDSDTLLAYLEPHIDELIDNGFISRELISKIKEMHPGFSNAEAYLMFLNSTIRNGLSNSTIEFNVTFSKPSVGSTNFWEMLLFPGSGLVPLSLWLDDLGSYFMSEGILGSGMFDDIASTYLWLFRSAKEGGAAFVVHIIDAFFDVYRAISKGVNMTADLYMAFRLELYNILNMDIPLNILAEYLSELLHMSISSEDLRGSSIEEIKDKIKAWVDSQLPPILMRMPRIPQYNWNVYKFYKSMYDEHFSKYPFGGILFGLIAFSVNLPIINIVIQSLQTYLYELPKFIISLPFDWAQILARKLTGYTGVDIGLDFFAGGIPGVSGTGQGVPSIPWFGLISIIWDLFH